MSEDVAETVLEEFRNNGFVSESTSLDNLSQIDAVIKDTAIFDRTLLEYKASGYNRVPYIITPSIAAISRDKNIVNAVENILETNQWVMWGSNIRSGIPNEAHLWHVDLESVLWPTITVAVGLQGCNEKCATWLIPQSDRIGRGPSTMVKNCSETGSVLKAARSANKSCGEPQQIAGFSDGKFYIFDAKTWHKGDATSTGTRTLLFLHYQKSADKRIPYMLDYKLRHWSRATSPFIKSPSCSSVRKAVYWPPIRQLPGSLYQTIKNWLR